MSAERPASSVVASVLLIAGTIACIAFGAMSIALIVGGVFQ